MICFICNKYISFAYTRWYLCCNALLQIKLDNSILSLSIKIIVFPKTFLLKWKQNIPEQHLFHSSMFSFLALSAILLPLSAQCMTPFIRLRFFFAFTTAMDTKKTEPFKSSVLHRNHISYIFLFWLQKTVFLSFF